MTVPKSRAIAPPNTNFNTTPHFIKKRKKNMNVVNTE